MALDEAMRCLCACRVEEGEIVCCEVCQGWSHLRCIDRKEGVGVFEGKEFVCHLCMLACLLALHKKVGELRKDLRMTKSEVNWLREENGKLKDQSGLSVQKRIGQVNGKDGWWFVVKAPEKNLLKLDKVWQHRHW